MAGGMPADSKYRIGAGGVGSAGEEAAGVRVGPGGAGTNPVTVGFGPIAEPVDGATGTGDPIWTGSTGAFKPLPHDWQLVCPRKTRVAPQKRHVMSSDP